MNSQIPRGPTSNGWSWTNLLRDLVATWRLMLDPSVPGLLKFALPLLAFLYWIWPIDLMPMMPFDDIAVLLLAARIFVALAPSASVDRAFGGKNAPSAKNYGPTPNASGTSGAGRPEDGEIIETTWRIVE